MFGLSPSVYFGVEDTYMKMAIDLACAGAFWTDENYKYEQSKEKAGEEAAAMNRELAMAREESEGR